MSYVEWDGTNGRCIEHAPAFAGGRSLRLASMLSGFLQC